MYESILPLPQSRLEDVVLDEQDDASDTALREVLEVIESIESGDEIRELAENLGIQFDYDGSVLTPVQRQALSKICLAKLGFEPDNAFDTTSFEIREQVKEPDEEGILVEQAMAKGERFHYDGSKLELREKEAIFKKSFAMHLKLNGLRSPQYYKGKSQCLSVAETAWPSVVAMLKAEKLKQGYIEPEDLIKRLGKLKPSHNFELRKFRHPRMEWKSPTPLKEEGLEIGPSWPSWVMDQLYAVSDMEKRMGRKSTAQCHQQIKNSAIQHRQEIRDRWAAFESSVELAPLPDLHLLKDMGRSPGGTLFPWYLVKGLITLREDANNQGGELYNEEYDSAMVKREEAIDRWRERNTDSILADDPRSIYRTWPADLMDELDEIDREAILCGRRKYVAVLRKAEKKMQALVTFWRDCGLVTGQRTPPSCWWQDPKARVKRLPKPQYLKERLDAINVEFGYHSNKAEKLRMIETSRWIESTANTDSDPIAADTPLPQSLLDELEIVWRDRDWLDGDDTEDEIIARIRRWRMSKHQQHFRERKLLRDNASGSVMALKETRQLREKLSRGARRQPRMTPMAEDRTIWLGRLRSRPNAVGTSRDRTKATNTQTGKP